MLAGSALHDLREAMEGDTWVRKSVRSADMAERQPFTHLFKPGQRKIDPPKSPHGSWWLDTKPEGFTDLAKTKITEPLPLTLKPLSPKEYD